MTFLDELLDGARRRVAAAVADEPLDALRERALGTPTPPSFVGALTGRDVAVIAEVKRASPSKGDLAPGLSAARQAALYRDGGVAAISVLTEPARFKGSLGDLSDVAALRVPTLRKDFVVDPYQVWEARVAGASAVLLIVAALDDETLGALSVTCRDAGLDALVEVHDADELQRAIAIGADVVGVNARDLRTFEVDRAAFARLRGEFPPGTLAVAESGIRGPADVVEAARLGADAVLVGEALVTAGDPRAAARALVEAGRRETVA